MPPISYLPELLARSGIRFRIRRNGFLRRLFESWPYGMLAEVEAQVS